MKDFFLLIVIGIYLGSCDKQEEPLLYLGDTFIFETNVSYEFDNIHYVKNYLLKNCLLIKRTNTQLDFINQSMDKLTGKYTETKFELHINSEDSINYFSPNSFFSGLDSAFLYGWISKNKIEGTVDTKLLHYYFEDTGMGSVPKQESIWANGNFFIRRQ